MCDDDDLRIERLGGLAGMGLPRSHLRSQGRLSLQALSKEDRAALDRLFLPARRGRSQPTVCDGLRYRLTRTTATGVQQVVEVMGEALLPQALLDCIRDTLD